MKRTKSNNDGLRSFLLIFLMLIVGMSLQYCGDDEETTTVYEDDDDDTAIIDDDDDDDDDNDDDDNDDDDNDDNDDNDDDDNDDDNDTTAPPDVPLGHRNTWNCYICHDVHDLYYTPPEECYYCHTQGTVWNTPPGPDLDPECTDGLPCAMCHTTADMHNGIYPESSMCDVCHRAPDKNIK